MVHRKTTLTFMLLATVLAWAACDDSDSDGGGQQLGEEVSVSVLATLGGSVTASDANAVLFIPPEGLEKDTTITVKVFEGSSKTVGYIYDFGPNGLTFLHPASLRVAVDPTMADVDDLVLAVEENGKFVPLAGSTYDDDMGRISAPVEHFSRFAVISRKANTGGGGGGGSNAACNAAIASFSPCGGNLVGSWKVESICATDFEDETTDSCPGATSEMRFIHDGFTMTFDGSTLSSGGSRLGVQIESRLPASCLEGLACSDLSALGFMQCTGTDTCVCLASFEDEEPAMSAAYTVSGSRLTVNDIEEEEPAQYDYCVQGNTLYMYGIPEEGAEEYSALFVAKRI